MTATSWVIFDIILFLLMLVPLCLSINLHKNVPFVLPLKNYHLFFIVGILVYCLFDKASGDYYHYEEIIKEMSSQRTITTHLEYVYVLIAQFIQFNYFLFRLIVWGTASSLFSICIKQTALRSDLVYILFILCSIPIFSYARVSLGICLFLLGYILIVKTDQHKALIIRIIIGALLILSSIFFHKSLFVLILLFPFSFIKLTPKVLLASILLFPIFVRLTNILAGDLLMANIELAGMNYLNQEKMEQGWGMAIYNMLINSGLLVLSARIIYNFSFKKKELPSYIYKMYTFTYLIFYTSLVLSYLEIGHNAISYRIKNMIFYFLPFIFAYYTTHIEKNKKLLLTSYMLIFIGNLYYLIYMYYWKYIGNY